MVQLLSTMMDIGIPADSPYTGWMQYSLANLLSPEGELILIDGIISVFDSYGLLSTTFWWVDISGAPDSYLHNDVSYSYGRKIAGHGQLLPLVFCLPLWFRQQRQRRLCRQFLRTFSSTNYSKIL